MNYRIGGREYPMVRVPQCLTCNSPYRFEIEESIVSGRTWTKISESLAITYGDEFAISVDALKDHFQNGHMPLEQAETRTLIETRARRVGKRIEDSAEELVDGITLLSAVVVKTFEEIASGRKTPDISDGIRAAKLLADFGEYDGGGIDQQAYVEAFLVYQEEAEKVMGAELFAQFGEALAANPVLAALASRYEGDGHDVVQGSVEQVSQE